MNDIIEWLPVYLFVGAFFMVLCLGEIVKNDWEMTQLNCSKKARRFNRIDIVSGVFVALLVWPALLLVRFVQWGRK